MELTVLGASASFPAPGDACSGYLVRDRGTRLLLDCGSGVLGRLGAEAVLADLSAIVVSHFHPDHFLDLVPMRYGLRYGIEPVPPPLLLVPPGGRAYLAGVGGALRGAPAFFAESFQVVEYDPTTETRVGGLGLRFQRTSHDLPTWAIGVVGAGGARLVYGADTRACPELEAFAAGADLLLCEATYPDGAGDRPSDNHLTSAEAGRLGRRAGAGRLVLTHFWPGFGRERFRPAAQAAFGGPVTLAAPGLRLTVGGAPASAEAGEGER